MMKKWAQENGLSDVYAAYEADVDAMVEGLQAEGLPTSGSTYEVRLEAIRERYPELFGDDEQDGPPAADPEGMMEMEKQFQDLIQQDGFLETAKKNLKPEAYAELVRIRNRTAGD